ncbi:hypothetical protein RUM43_011744 [Polyplax serrata]|uniref:Uncharacterized protein n=1 Tax=Polyplax serrata TaxID=468196 RepID=A0AAN8PIV9_POLSC
MINLSGTEQEQKDEGTTTTATTATSKEGTKGEGDEDGHPLGDTVTVDSSKMKLVVSQTLIN